mgnify:CR=1 FL=1
MALVLAKGILFVALSALPAASTSVMLRGVGAPGGRSGLNFRRAGPNGRHGVRPHRPQAAKLQKAPDRAAKSAAPRLHRR